MTSLTYKNCWSAPGYRDLRLVLVDPATGKEYELQLSPKDVQTLIFECAGAVKQIGDHPPLDWEFYRAQIVWPTITPWKLGPARTDDQCNGSPARV
jgi:hypothetical protein